MRAMVMTAPGGPEVLEWRDVERPEPGPQDLLVRLQAAGVNPVDTKLRCRGTYFPDRWPTILGCDGAGVVEAIGAGVSRFKPGDAVFFCNGGIGGPNGNYAEYAVVNELQAALKPVALDAVHAAAIPLVLITAWEALYDRARMASGRKVLIHAGAGGVGHVAIQLARDAGCEVATTISGTEKAELVRTLGADRAIHYQNEDFVAAVRDWSGGDGADIALDTIGGKTFERTFEAVRPYGDLVSLLQPDEVDWRQARLRNLRLSLELMLSPMVFGWPDALQHQGWILEQGARMVDTGKLRIHLSYILPLKEAAEAHRLLEKGGMSGKIVLAVD